MRLGRQSISPQVLAALSRAPQVTEQVRAVATAIRDDARALAPAATGRLRRGIRVERDTDPGGRVGYIVGWDSSAFYGLLVEQGSEHEPPRPHLVPAAIKNGAEAAAGGGGR